MLQKEIERSVGAHASNQFVELLWDFYAHNARQLPWRQPEAGGDFSPYRILLSEVMLQQTQVARVIPKYQQFLNRFPTNQALARASLADVLEVWSGLGYNRRAKFLHAAARMIEQEYGGEIPKSLDSLMSLPGIGRNTAAAILVYSYNQPHVFIETNIRTVYLHHFFANEDDVPDTAILPLVEQTIDHDSPREFYWALMDYGTHLKATIGNASRRSKHHIKQSRFEGSRRQLRGRVLKELLDAPKTHEQLSAAMKDDRLSDVLSALEKEGFIVRELDHFILA